MTDEQFKANFQPGDIICRNSNGYPLLITAIGVRRFLHISMNSNRDERVAMIGCLTAKWRRWDPTRYPDKAYEYVKETKPDQWALTTRHKIEIDLTGY